MTRDDVLRFFDAQREAWASRDAAALTAAHHEHGTIISPIFRTVAGRKEILDSYRALFAMFPDWTYTGDPVLVDGLRVAQPFHVEATHGGDFMGVAGTGRRVEIQGVRVFEMRDGLIGFEQRYYDFTGLLIQAGILRGKPAI
jgi:predicted ester cyclase